MQTGMFKLLSVIVWSFVFLFLSFSSAKAITFTLSGVPASTNVDQSFSVSVTLTIGNSAGKKYYLRSAFYENGTSNYFGYTKNHYDSWYNGSPSIDTHQYKEVTMDSFNTWTGVVEVKPDSSSSKYKGPGDYGFKIGYYTDTQTSTTVSEWTNSSMINITGSSTASPSPSPSPSPTAIASPSPSSNPSPHPSLSPSPRSSPAVLSIASPTPVKKASPTPSPMETVLADSGENREFVLGINSTNESGSLGEENATPSPNPKASALDVLIEKPVAIGLVGIGVLMIAFSVFSFLKGRSSGRIEIHGED